MTKLVLNANAVCKPNPVS